MFHKRLFLKEPRLGWRWMLPAGNLTGQVSLAPQVGLIFSLSNPRLLGRTQAAGPWEASYCFSLKSVHAVTSTMLQWPGQSTWPSLKSRVSRCTPCVLVNCRATWQSGWGRGGRMVLPTESHASVFAPTAALDSSPSQLWCPLLLSGRGQR